MKQIRQTTVDEPMGIVIAGGLRPEPPPRFFAYVWGPAPEREADAEQPAAAA